MKKGGRSFIVMGEIWEEKTQKEKVRYICISDNFSKILAI